MLANLQIFLTDEVATNNKPWHTMYAQLHTCI